MYRETVISITDLDLDLGKEYMYNVDFNNVA